MLVTRCGDGVIQTVPLRLEVGVSVWECPPNKLIIPWPSSDETAPERNDKAITLNCSYGKCQCGLLVKKC